MKANWSLVLNVFLLIGVVYSIFRLLSTRKKSAELLQQMQYSNEEIPESADDIISIRKLVSDDEEYYSTPIHQSSSKNNQKFVKMEVPVASSSINLNPDSAAYHTVSDDEPLMMFILAKEGKKLAGYELLQAILSTGLRFGEGDLFHRHQYANGQGTVMCSLAAATAQGTFDLQNMGSFAVRGLCIYMHLSGNACIDEERFDIMFDTAKSLSEDLDAYLLDDFKNPISDKSISRYTNRIKIETSEIA